jgi:hypothetical protein
LNSKQPQFYLQRGVAFEGSREFDKAVADYRAALALEPELPGAKSRLARIESRGRKK